jgi:hypothetical protein
MRVHLVGMGSILLKAQSRRCPALATRLPVVIACGRWGGEVKIVRSDERRPSSARGRDWARVQPPGRFQPPLAAGPRRLREPRTHRFL